MPLKKAPSSPSKAPVAPAIDVRQGLSSSDPDVRWAAARAAADDSGMVEALAAAARRETNARVREALFTSLSRIGSGQSFDALLPFLRADEAGLRTSALDAMRTMTQTVRERLPALLADADSDVRVLSCELARGLPAEEATAALSALLMREREANVCAAAIDVLAEIGDAGALPALAECQTRFSDSPFLVFAIKVATDRIRSQSTRRHV